MAHSVLKLAALMLSAAIARPVPAVELRAADIQPEAYPNVIALQNLGKKLEAASRGRFSLRVFAGGVLGDERAMIEQTQAGSIDLLRASLGSVGTIVPEVNVFNLPFVFRDETHMRKVIDGPIGDELLQKITDSPANLVALGWMDAGTRNVYARKPVHKPADLSGMKIRMIGNPLFVDTMNAMGGIGVSMGWNDVAAALQAGLVDGAENNVPSYTSAGHYGSAGYYSLTGHLIVPEIIVFSKLKWMRLSKEDQTLIRKLAREAQHEQRQLWDKRIAADTTQLKAAGVSIVSDVDKDAFFKATQPIRNKYGAPYAELIARIQALR